MDVSTAVEEIRARIGELTPDFWTSAGVLRALNEACRRFAAQERWPWLYSVASDTLPAETETLELSTGVSLHRQFDLLISFSGDSRPRMPRRVTPAEGTKLRGRLYTTASEPVAYYLYSAESEGDNEVFTLVNAGTTVGTFTITVDSQTTAVIARGASAATIRNAIKALSNVGPADVKVTGGPLGTDTIRIEFTGQLAHSAIPMSIGGTTTNMTLTELVEGGTGSGFFAPTVRFVPALSREATVEYQYIRAITDVIDDTSTLDVPDDYVMGVVAYATGLLWLKELNDSRKADEQFALFGTIVDDAKRDLRKLVGDEDFAWGSELPQPMGYTDEVYRHFTGPLGS